MWNSEQNRHRTYQDYLREAAMYLEDAEKKKKSPTQARLSIQAAKNLLQQLRTAFPSRPVLFPASVKTTNGVKWGYINTKGSFIIPPRYEAADDFQANGLAGVQSKERNGVINSSGQFVVPPIYNTVTQFSEGRAQILDDKGFRVIDESGKILTPKWYTYIGMYQEGRAIFAQADAQGNSLYGYLDRDGKEVIPAKYPSANDFRDGKAVVQLKENEYALIDRNGTTLHTYPHALVGSLGDGLMSFKQTPDGLFGYMDEQGKVVISPQFSVALPFEKGRAVINASKDFTANLYGLIDKKGNEIIKPVYNDVQTVGEDRVAVGKARIASAPYAGSRYAIADWNGKLLSEFVYTDVSRFHQGIASATDGQRTFFIYRNGRIARNLPIVSGVGTLTLTGDIVKAVVDMRTSYYDRSGKLIYAQNTLIPLRGDYRVREEKYAPNKDYLVYYPQIEGIKDRSAEQRINQMLKERSKVKKIEPNAQLTSSYSGDFEVEFFQKDLLVLQLSGYEYPFGAAHGMPSEEYVHIDLAKAKTYQLKDLFLPNSDYVRVLSEIIGQQIKTDPQYSYVFPDSYKGIKPDQPFYVKEDALMIYFAPYEIAPYAAGFPTFRIPYEQIQSLINTRGDFWRSFH
ncbi:WG repeat-containing protein [Brevibacillus migulae]|uniref:WG repeat-containing protein n=1 Tax=Brevibacillus migulae TaxID=1644114 RepID=UPI00106ED8F5|nr:WG repeat-containing protein [Brevibacillus migulae]